MVVSRYGSIEPKHLRTPPDNCSRVAKLRKGFIQDWCDFLLIEELAELQTWNEFRHREWNQVICDSTLLVHMHKAGRFTARSVIMSGNTFKSASAGRSALYEIVRTISFYDRQISFNDRTHKRCATNPTERLHLLNERSFSIMATLV